MSLGHAENSKYQAGIYWNWNSVAGAECLPQRKTSTSCSFLGQTCPEQFHTELDVGSSRNWKCFNWELTQCRLCGNGWDPLLSYLTFGAISDMLSLILCETVGTGVL